jgi:hypothetical protein
MDKLSEEMELDTDGLLDETIATLGSGDEFRMAGSGRAGDKGEDGTESEKSSDVSEGREYASVATVMTDVFCKIDIVWEIKY